MSVDEVLRIKGISALGYSQVSRYGEYWKVLELKVDGRNHEVATIESMNKSGDSLIRWMFTEQGLDKRFEVVQ